MMLFHRKALAFILATLLPLASCGGPPPDRGFTGVTRARCANGDTGACRMLRAMAP